MTKTSKKTKEVQVQTPTTNKVDMTKYDGLETTSSKIRMMTSDGLSRSEISKLLNIRYQHVRNVLITPLKKQG